MGGNRNTIVGFVLIFGILIGYYFWMSPSQEELAEQQRKRDSIALIQRHNDSVQLANEILRTKQLQIEQQRLDSLKAEGALPATEQGSDYVQLLDKYGAFASSAEGEEDLYFIETDLFKIGISTKGGEIKYVELLKYKTFDSLPLVLIESDTNVFGLTFSTGTRTVNTSGFFFKPFINGQPADNKKNIRISGDEAVDLSMRLYADQDESSVNENKYIEFLYKIKGNNYMLDYDMNFHGTNDLINATPGYIDLEWTAHLRKQEKSVDRLAGSTIYYKIKDDKTSYLSENKDDEESLKDKIKWASFKQPFFSSTLIAKKDFSEPIFSVWTDENPVSDRYLRSMSMKLGVPYSNSADQTVEMSFYFGPNKYNVMTKYKLDLERQIPLGWSFFLMQWINRYVVLPVFNYLGSFGWNYGIVILVLTILLKTVLFPIAYKTYLSSARMRVLKPEIDELAKKYPKKEDGMKKQQATMSLYKKAGVNPMSGCVPMLLQFPILIALFRFFPASIELRQQSFLWATDLSTYDSILDLPFNIPFYGDHVSLFTLLMTAATLVYTFVNNQMMTTGTQQMPGMKTMMYLMPIMFLGFFNSYASGLSYYYFLVNVITLLQMFIFRALINEDKIRVKIEANKKKTVKKSAFQQRLEDAAKQRGYNPKKKKK